MSNSHVLANLLLFVLVLTSYPTISTLYHWATALFTGSFVILALIQNLYVSKEHHNIWAVTCDFQQCGSLTCVDSDEPLQPPFKLRNSKWCSVSSLTVKEYSSDKQRLWSDCAYAQAGLSNCWSHIPRWKSHVAAHILSWRDVIMDSLHADVASENDINWIQCISNVSKIGIFLQWKNIVSFHKWLILFNHFTAAKQDFLVNFGTRTFFKWF